MTALRRRALAAVALFACAAPFGVAQAQDSTGEAAARLHDNFAIAHNSTDETRMFEFAWSLRRQRGGDVDHRNLASAIAQCTNCRATAIAFQIVLVSGTPTSFTPRNRAVAGNDQCVNCVVYAGPRQFVRVVPAGGARFTGEGRAILADVREQLRALEGQDLGPDALHAAVEAQEARVTQVLLREVVTRTGEPQTLSSQPLP